MDAIEQPLTHQSVVHGEVWTFPAMVEFEDGSSAMLLHMEDFKQVFRFMRTPQGNGFVAMPELVYRGRRSTILWDHPTVQ